MLFSCLIKEAFHAFGGDHYRKSHWSERRSDRREPIPGYIYSTNPTLKAQGTLWGSWKDAKSHLLPPGSGSLLQDCVFRKTAAPMKSNNMAALNKTSYHAYVDGGNPTRPCSKGATGNDCWEGESWMSPYSVIQYQVVTPKHITWADSAGYIHICVGLCNNYQY